ncbi:hypothetical protein SUGI_0300670 [Cryptomeria japonica]|nr:hypothetical protein SUGI_0300670 [Cryptomeria japonica]
MHTKDLIRMGAAGRSWRLFLNQVHGSKKWKLKPFKNRRKVLTPKENFVQKGKSPLLEDKNERGLADSSSQNAASTDVVKSPLKSAMVFSEKRQSDQVFLSCNDLFGRHEPGCSSSRVKGKDIVVKENPRTGSGKKNQELVYRDFFVCPQPNFKVGDLSIPVIEKARENKESIKELFGINMYQCQESDKDDLAFDLDEEEHDQSFLEKGTEAKKISTLKNKAEETNASEKKVEKLGINQKNSTKLSPDCREKGHGEKPIRKREVLTVMPKVKWKITRMLRPSILGDTFLDETNLFRGWVLVLGRVDVEKHFLDVSNLQIIGRNVSEERRWHQKRGGTADHPEDDQPSSHFST